ncbi:hypothetical protein HPG69_005751 [Diceros bicornis minor]|uniref:Uncharacterized protein n=1 Tax=Diceros bicornis minor TaxID=77932 RepID=A0A7J7ESB8_DICBM|nr:hypothetical protein HPG69_005751 [Diceros bicornis minor]
MSVQLTSRREIRKIMGMEDDDAQDSTQLHNKGLSTPPASPPWDGLPTLLTTEEPLLVGVLPWDHTSSHWFRMVIHQCLWSLKMRCVHDWCQHSIHFSSPECFHLICKSCTQSEDSKPLSLRKSFH